MQSPFLEYFRLLSVEDPPPKPVKHLTSFRQLRDPLQSETARNATSWHRSSSKEDATSHDVTLGCKHDLEDGISSEEVERGPTNCGRSFSYPSARNLGLGLRKVRHVRSSPAPSDRTVCGRSRGVQWFLGRRVRARQQIHWARANNWAIAPAYR